MIQYVEQNRELYITPYHYQSRCIGVESKDWGMWVPDPEYHFTEFSDNERNIINTSMVAMLVKLYDDKRKCGLSKVRLDGGDFMIEKGFEEDFHLKNVLEKMRLIAARKLVPMEFDEYIDIMKHELSGQVSEYEDRFIIGKTLRCPMSIEEINKGIELGLKLRKEQVKVKQYT